MCVCVYAIEWSRARQSERKKCDLENCADERKETRHDETKKKSETPQTKRAKTTNTIAKKKKKWMKTHA